MTCCRCGGHLDRRRRSTSGLCRGCYSTALRRLQGVLASPTARADVVRALTLADPTDHVRELREAFGGS